MTCLTIETPEAFEPLLQAGKRYRGAYGGRGGSKSWFFATLLIERALADVNLRAVCIREVQKSIDQSVKRLLEDTIIRLGVGHYFRILNTHIEFGQTGHIAFQGMQNHTAESIKSLEGYDIAWVEEAQSVSAKSLELLRPTIRKPKSELWFSWNPRDAKDPVDQLLRGKNPPEDSVVVFTSYKDNPWFPEELRKEMEGDLKRDPERWSHIWWGDYETHSEARVFKNWTVEEHIAPVGAVFYYGADWGFSKDPNFCLRCYFDGRRLLIDYEVCEVGCEIDNTPGLYDKLGCENCSRGNPCDGTSKGHGEARKWVIRADSARPETISYMQKHGYPRVRPARKGAGSVEEGVIFLQSYDIVVHPRCKATINELTHYKYKVDKQTLEVVPILEDADNHAIDSLRYATEELRKSEKSKTTSPVSITKAGPITIGESVRRTSIRSQGW